MFYGVLPDLYFPWNILDQAGLQSSLRFWCLLCVKKLTHPTPGHNTYNCFWFSVDVTIFLMSFHSLGFDLLGKSWVEPHWLSFTPTFFCIRSPTWRSSIRPTAILPISVVLTSETKASAVGPVFLRKFSVSLHIRLRLPCVVCAHHFLFSRMESFVVWMSNPPKKNYSWSLNPLLLFYLEGVLISIWKFNQRNLLVETLGTKLYPASEKRNKYKVRVPAQFVRIPFRLGRLFLEMWFIDMFDIYVYIYIYIFII